MSDTVAGRSGVVADRIKYRANVREVNGTMVIGGSLLLLQGFERSR